jgi:hypothetical protein
MAILFPTKAFMTSLYIEAQHDLVFNFLGSHVKVYIGGTYPVYLFRPFNILGLSTNLQLILELLIQFQ